MRNFQQLAAGLAEAPVLLHQVYLHPELWNQDKVRTQHAGSPHGEVDDILLRFQPTISVRGVIDDPECINYAAWDVLPAARKIVFDLARVVEAERIGRVIISRLPPGRTIASHVDGGAVARYYSRYQVSLQNERGSLFHCEGEQVRFQPGDVWWFDNKRMHAVVNNSASDRIAMIVDLKTR